MKRIKIIESNQGRGGTRVQEGAWQRLLQLENGYFEKSGNEYDFYTNDGLLIKAIKDSDDYTAKHFGAKNNLLYVDYCEPGLGISLIDENISNPNEFLLRSTGFYDAFGNSFFIKFVVLEGSESISIPNVWSFQKTYKKTDIEKLKHFLFHSVFEHPQEGELLCKSNDELAEIVLNYRGTYYRKLCTQMGNAFNNGSFKGDTSWHSIYFSLKRAQLVKDHNGYVNFC